MGPIWKDRIVDTGCGLQEDEATPNLFLCLLRHLEDKTSDQGLRRNLHLVPSAPYLSFF